MRLFEMIDITTNLEQYLILLGLTTLLCKILFIQFLVHLENIKYYQF